MTPRPAGDPDELALLAAGFPAFRVWRETCLDRIRYVSRARDLSSHPHTVVTGSLPELAAALAAGQEQDRRH